MRFQAAVVLAKTRKRGKRERGQRHQRNLGGERERRLWYRAERKGGGKCHRSNGSLHKRNEEASGRRLGGTRSPQNVNKRAENSLRKGTGGGKQAGLWRKTYMPPFNISIFQTSVPCGCMCRHSAAFGWMMRARIHRAPTVSLCPGVRTHPVRVVLRDPAALGVELVVARSGSGLLVLAAQPLETLIAAERQRGRCE